MKQNYSFINLTCFSLLIFAILNILSNFLLAQKLSEIMFFPSESNSEFIELFNPTDTIINLENYKIIYHTSGADQFSSSNLINQLLPQQYAVIFEADYDLDSGIYSKIVPENALTFTLENNAFGSRGMSNSDDRTIFLLDSVDDTIDVCTYSANNKEGYSDEKKDISTDYWENSKIINGSPGFKNSVSPMDFDLSISNFFANTQFVTLGESLDINVTIKNIGSKTADQFTVNIYSDTNKSNLINSDSFFDLSPLDSINFVFSFSNFVSGDNNFFADINYEYDEFLDNNSKLLTIKGIKLNEIRGDIIINEFMYAPQSDEAEWIEIYNKSEKEINLKNYQVADKTDTNRIIDKEYFLFPGMFLVFADDTSFFSKYNIDNVMICNLPTLNNGGDNIVLLDSLNRVIDSISYSSEWGGNNGRSIERIDPHGFSEDNLNWRESLFPTPGKINSFTQKEYDLKLDIVYTDSKFPLIETETKIVAKIINIGKKTSEFYLQLFLDSNNDSIADTKLEESNILSLHSYDSLDYTFTYEAWVSNSSQNYLINILGEDNDTTNNDYLFTLTPSYQVNSFLINEIMYSPVNLEPEWVELYNNSKFDINIKNWEISDVLTNPVGKKLEQEIIVPSESYIIITKDSSILEFHRNINSIIVKLPFANLNNDEDGIVFKDSNQRTIDSLIYNESWNGRAGKSIERINLEFGSNNANNWGNSIDLEGSTPGRINSITPKDHDLFVHYLLSDPMYPIEGEEIYFNTKIHNYGKQEASDFNVEFYVNEGNQAQLFESFNNLSLLSLDSIVIKSTKSVKIQDTLILSIIVKYNLDQDLNNNYYEQLIVSGFNKNTVLINEIMFNPNSGDPEWIELYNNTELDIDISKWLIGDIGQRTMITENETVFSSNDYLIITNYLSGSYFSEDVYFLEVDLPSLGNKDAVILYDFRNAIIDSVYYDIPTNSLQGISLERISLDSASIIESNWTLSLETTGSTPYYENSITVLPDNTFGDVIITEIMYDPIEGNSEFIEFYNLSNEQVELGNWKIEHKDEKVLNILNSSYTLNSKEYFILAADSTILINYNWLADNNNYSILNVNSLDLTNQEKTFYLKDYKNNIIDSVHYQSSWHNPAFLETKGTSLELINSNISRNENSNWSSSVSEFGATPGKQNSINVNNVVSESKLEISPNPFSPDNDGFEDFTFINYKLNEPLSQIRIRVFDSKGRQVRSIANNQSVGSEGAIIFDGLDENKNALKIGIYIILFEAVNLNNSVFERIKDVVVVARKL